METEMREFIHGLRVAVPKIIARAKDGVNVDDAVALASDPEFRAACVEIVNGAKNLPAEAKEFSLQDLGDLAPDIVGLVIDIAKAVQAPKAAA